MKTLKKNAFIVSCQAEEGEPLFGKETMVKMSIAAQMGGADAIRSLYPDVVKEVKNVVSIPIIGITKNRNLKGAFITTTKKDIDELVQAKADFIALDCTRRERPEPLPELFNYLKSKYPNIGIIADIADIDDVKNIIPLKPDYIATTLSGYTDYSINRPCPDYELIREIIKITDIPVIAEGNLSTPLEARKAILNGAYAVTVGTAITRPQIITQRFKEYLADFQDDELLAVGIDIGGTWTRGVLVDRFGIIKDSDKVRTASTGKEVISNMLSLIKKLKTEETHFLGVASGGRIDFKTGVVGFSTGLIPDWKGVGLADIIEKEFNIRPIVDNDANCASYFQHFITDEDNMLMITVGTGIGGGIINDGRIVRGAKGGGGEIGHIIYPGNTKECSCGKVGCVETILSGRYLKENIYGKEGKEVYKKIREYSKVMAWFIDTLKATLDFDKCYLGGVLPNYGDEFLENIKNSFKQISNEKNADFINYSDLGEFAGARGAALLSLHKGEI